MNKLYNTQEDFAREFNKFVKEIGFHLRKTQENIVPYIILAMILAESSVSTDIACQLKGQFSEVQFNSVTKRIKRLFNNKLFDAEELFKAIIIYVIENYKKKHSDRRVHIIIDHMFSHGNYTVLMFSMRVGKQGIPIWFKAFRNKDDTGSAFEEKLIIEGINWVIDQFDKKGLEITFLADRWFNSTNLMSTIADAGHKFCFRLKGNIKSLIYDKKEDHKIWKLLSDVKNYEHHSVMYENVEITNNKFTCNVVYSKRKGTDDPWILATNTNYRQSIKDYNYRFGGIETLFKNQKSNGFYIESVVNANEKAFRTMYALVCIAELFLTILGAEFSKNSKCYKNVKIETHKNYKNKGKIRVMSLFQTGLTLFKRAFNSHIYIRIPIRFILYDI